MSTTTGICRFVLSITARFLSLISIGVLGLETVDHLNHPANEDLMDEQRIIDWSDAAWLNPPLRADADEDGLLVTTRPRTDFWRTTGYGFVHDDGHALLAPFAAGTAVEAGFVARLDHLYDQAGIMVRVDAATWIKAGIELSDGLPQIGAVVTHERSDWSMAPVPDWAGRHVTMRVSRSGDAVTIRARCEGGPWRMVRLAPLPPEATAAAGPFCCSPDSDGLTVRFTRFVTGPADPGLHEAPH